MTWKCILTILALLIVQVTSGSFSLAQDSSEAPKKDSFNLYVEALAGSTDADPLVTGIISRSTEVSTGSLILDGNRAGRVQVGWELPKGKGSFLLRFEGHKEDSYLFSTVGSQSRAIDPTDGDPFETLAEAPLRWWTVVAANGTQSSLQTTPTWDPNLDDTDNDRVPDTDEVNFVPSPNTLSGPAPADLQNRVQSVDLLYQREFGGRRIKGRWSTGIRYFTYKGNVPAGAWLHLDEVGVGFTNGGVLPLLSFTQDSSGGGPSVTLEIQEHFFRDRLILFQQARAAFVIQSLQTDSGEFFTLVRDSIQNILIPATARLQTDLNKSSWQPGLDLGARIRLLEGFHLNLVLSLSSFQDAVILPTQIIIPENPGQATQGVAGIYKTQDLQMEGFLAGLSFQF